MTPQLLNESSQAQQDIDGGNYSNAQKLITDMQLKLGASPANDGLGLSGLNIPWWVVAAILLAAAYTIYRKFAK